MESSGTVYHNIHLKKVLRSYQSAASSSLSGPNAILPVYGSATGESIGADCGSEPRVGDEFRTLKLKRHKSQRELHPPILTAADRSWSEWSETVLDGFPIACFVVGGEKRLCLPQVMNSVLGQFHVSEIYAVCDELHIYCSLCSPQQLEMLKTAAILPRTAPSCGLITFTDAQRLCSFLLRTPPRISNGLTGFQQLRQQQQQQQKVGWFRVYHECFGKCEGICKPELYDSSTSRCIECADCGMLLAPQHFVSHAHRGLQNRTCHWGFDAQSWRAYLLLARRQIGYELLLRQLEKFKEKFAAAPQHVPHTKRKQKVEESDKISVDVRTLAKKCKEEPEDYMVHPHMWYPQSLLPFNASSQLPFIHPDNFYQPNVTLSASKKAQYNLPATPSLPATQPSHNPEIELSSTDTDDTDSAGAVEPEKLKYALTPGLHEEISRVEELLKAGKCAVKESADVLKAFRRLCCHIALKANQQEWQKQQQLTLQPPSAKMKWAEDQLTGATLEAVLKVKREPQPLDYS